MVSRGENNIHNHKLYRNDSPLLLFVLCEIFDPHLYTGVQAEPGIKIKRKKLCIANNWIIEKEHLRRNSNKYTNLKKYTILVYVQIFEVGHKGPCGYAPGSKFLSNTERDYSIMSI